MICRRAPTVPYLDLINICIREVVIAWVLALLLIFLVFFNYLLLVDLSGYLIIGRNWLIVLNICTDSLLLIYDFKWLYYCWYWLVLHNLATIVDILEWWSTIVDLVLNICSILRYVSYQSIRLRLYLILLPNLSSFNFLIHILLLISIIAKLRFNYLSVTLLNKPWAKLILIWITNTLVKPWLLDAICRLRFTFRYIVSWYLFLSRFIEQLAGSRHPRNHADLLFFIF